MTPNNLNFYTAVQSLRSGNKSAGSVGKGEAGIDPMLFIGGLLMAMLVGLIAMIVWFEFNPPNQGGNPIKPKRAEHRSTISQPHAP